MGCPCLVTTDRVALYPMRVEVEISASSRPQPYCRLRTSINPLVIIDLHKCTCQAPAFGHANVQNVPEAFHKAELPAPVTTPCRLLQRSQWNEAEPPERTIQFRVWRCPHTSSLDALNFGTFRVHFYAKLSLAHFLSSFLCIRMLIPVRSSVLCTPLK